MQNLNDLLTSKTRRLETFAIKFDSDSAAQATLRNRCGNAWQPLQGIGNFFVDDPVKLFPAFISGYTQYHYRNGTHVKLENHRVFGAIRQVFTYQIDTLANVVGRFREVGIPVKPHRYHRNALHRRRRDLVNVLHRCNTLFDDFSNARFDLVRAGATIRGDNRNNRNIHIRHQIYTDPGVCKTTKHHAGDKNHTRGYWPSDAKFREFHRSLSLSMTLTGLPSRMNSRPRATICSPGLSPLTISTLFSSMIPIITWRLTAKPFSIT
ncbi:MAG: hypothetical protein ACD_39C01416G0001 [uncultured bacterium]|nr:MAG: hypothetical protein ACD_39C01416G0001 [uncultured bacterium]